MVLDLAHCYCMGCPTSSASPLPIVSQVNTYLYIFCSWHLSWVVLDLAHCYCMGCPAFFLVRSLLVEGPSLGSWKTLLCHSPPKMIKMLKDSYPLSWNDIYEMVIIKVPISWKSVAKSLNYQKNLLWLWYTQLQETKLLESITSIFNALITSLCNQQIPQLFSTWRISKINSFWEAGHACRSLLNPLNESHWMKTLPQQRWKTLAYMGICFRLLSRWFSSSKS